MKTPNKILKKRIGSDGATMVELVVSFALIGLFMVAALSAITAYTKIYTKINTSIKQQQISATLLDRIGSVMVRCSHSYDDVVNIKDSESVINEAEILLADGSKAEIFVTIEGKLRIEYSNTNEAGDIESSQTGFGDGFYFDNYITSLKINRLQNNKGEDTSVIELSVSLKNSRYGYEYSAVKVVDCNVPSDAITVNP